MQRSLAISDADFAGRYLVRYVKAKMALRYHRKYHLLSSVLPHLLFSRLKDKQNVA